MESIPVPPPRHAPSRFFVVRARPLPPRLLRRAALLCLLGGIWPRICAPGAGSGRRAGGRLLRDAVIVVRCFGSVSLGRFVFCRKVLFSSLIQDGKSLLFLLNHRKDDKMLLLVRRRFKLRLRVNAGCLPPCSSLMLSLPCFGAVVCACLSLLDGLFSTLIG